MQLIDQSRTYGATARVLHWLTALLLAAQFSVGYSLDVGGHGRGRGRGRGLESGRGRGRGGELDFGDDLLVLHVALGVAILTVAVVRLWWRRRAGLPPWAETLSKGERTLAHWNERVLYALLFAIPLTGLWLVLVNDDAVGFHVGAHIVFFVAFATHVGLVLKHQVINRDGLLRRML
jgi:cytochrome b561